MLSVTVKVSVKTADARVTLPVTDWFTDKLTGGTVYYVYLEMLQSKSMPS